ncbi:trypsin-like serine protease [Roseivirga sp. E12]|uniref:S1 family peptidase n=1 Tax=Roseivirga sp. E12 TaxID=2819237 RepID=UPI001ABBF643|nr:trypsin-like serine protease [Roseivirga sp. E12]MBO3700277.1 trypsin-like serine protease [Roseivirga sp. E12]
MKLLSTVLIGLLCLTSTDDIVMRHDVDEAKYLALADQYAGSVIRLNAGCGTFIRSNWIITAAHVAVVPQIGEDVTVDGVKYKIKQKVIHPEFREGQSIMHDVALLELEKDVPDVELAKIYTKDDELGKEIIFAGTGWAGTGDKGMADGAINKDRKMRAAQNKIDGFRPSGGFIRFTFDAPDSKDALPLEGISGPGDSGGPALWFDGDQAYILGVSSHQDGRGMGRPEGRYGVYEYYTRVSDYADWIGQTIK